MNQSCQDSSDTLVEINKTLANLNKTVAMVSRRITELEQAQSNNNNSMYLGMGDFVNLGAPEPYVPPTLFQEVRQMVETGLGQIREHVTAKVRSRIRDRVCAFLGLSSPTTVSANEFEGTPGSDWYVPLEPVRGSNIWTMS